MEYWSLFNTWGACGYITDVNLTYDSFIKKKITTSLPNFGIMVVGYLNKKKKKKKT